MSLGNNDCCHIGASLRQLINDGQAETLIFFNVESSYCYNLALCYFAVVMELPNSLWMNCKSEFGVILTSIAVVTC